MRTASWLEFVVHDIDICVDEAVGEILEAHKKNDEEAINKAVEDYHKSRRMVYLGQEMLMCGLKEWSWQWAADEGQLCERDWEWFAEDLKKAGVNKEAYDKKWNVTES